MEPYDLIGYEKKNADSTQTQNKIIFFIHLMNRLILLKRFDIIREIYTNIIEQKINNYIKKYIETIIKIPANIDIFLENLKKNNFKGEKLNKKIEELSTNKTPYSTELIMDIIKYDYNINGFEGIYINENINGLIHFLSDKRLVPNASIEKPAVQLSEPFYIQQRNARILLMSANLMHFTKEELESSEATNVESNLIEKIKIGITGLFTPITDIDDSMVSRFNQLYTIKKIKFNKNENEEKTISELIQNLNSKIVELKKLFPKKEDNETEVVYKVRMINAVENESKQKNLYENYKNWISLAKRQRYFVNNTFTETAVKIEYDRVFHIINTDLDKIPKQLELKLPKLNKIKLPKIQNVGEYD